MIGTLQMKYISVACVLALCVLLIAPSVEGRPRGGRQRGQRRGGRGELTTEGTRGAERAVLAGTEEALWEAKQQGKPVRYLIEY